MEETKRYYCPVCCSAMVVFGNQAHCIKDAKHQDKLSGPMVFQNALMQLLVRGVEALESVAHSMKEEQMTNEQIEAMELESWPDELLREKERALRNEANRLLKLAARCRAIRIGRDAAMMLNEADAAKRRWEVSRQHKQELGSKWDGTCCDKCRRVKWQEEEVIYVPIPAT